MKRVVCVLLLFGFASNALADGGSQPQGGLLTVLEKTIRNAAIQTTTVPAEKPGMEVIIMPKQELAPPPQGNTPTLAKPVPPVPTPTTTVQGQPSASPPLTPVPVNPAPPTKETATYSDGEVIAKLEALTKGLHESREEVAGIRTQVSSIIQWQEREIVRLENVKGQLVELKTGQEEAFRMLAEARQDLTTLNGELDSARGQAANAQALANQAQAQANQAWAHAQEAMAAANKGPIRTILGALFGGGR